jgi:hypothetical protein
MFTWAHRKGAVFAEWAFSDEDTCQGRFSNSCGSNDDDVRKWQIQLPFASEVFWNFKVVLLHNKTASV